jgi:hypothetical protein
MGACQSADASPVATLTDIRNQCCVYSIHAVTEAANDYKAVPKARVCLNRKDGKIASINGSILPNDCIERDEFYHVARRQTTHVRPS